MQCLEDNDPDIKENRLKTMEPKMDLEKQSDNTKLICRNENIDIELDESSSTDESVINLRLSSTSTKTLIERTSGSENDVENKLKQNKNEESYESGVPPKIVNINLNEDVSETVKNDIFGNDYKQVTKHIDVPRTIKKSEKENLQGVLISTKSSNKSLKFISYTNLEYDIQASKSCCTLDTGISKPMNAKTIFRQGDIINVNTAQIKTIFNTYRKPFEKYNHSDLGIRENRTTNLKSIVSELASSFSISSDSKKGSFSSSNNYNASDVSQTTLTTSIAPNILIINSSTLFNQIYLDTDQTFERKHEMAIVINESQEEIDDRSNTISTQKNNESEKKFKHSCRNKSEVATVSVDIRPNFYKKKQVYSESNIRKDFKFNLTRFTRMKSVMSGTEDIYDKDEFKLKMTKNELWETLILALDMTAKRLEDTLSEKIISKVNKSLNILNRSINLPTQQNTDFNPITNLIGDTVKQGRGLNLKNPLLEKKEANLEIDACLQCDIVSTSFIDEHMQKFKLGNAKNQLKVKETRIVIDNLVGQQALGKKSLEASDENSPIVLTKVTTAKKRDQIGRFKTVLHNSFRFLVENALLIISVPSFLFVLFLLYGVILLATKPW